jgi:CheY-like chemotaxis protein
LPGESKLDQLNALIIDDNSQNVGILAHLLTRQGVNSTKVMHPKHLASTLQNIETIDVVFLDLELPGMDGYEILEMLKSDERFDAVPIVAYTVHVSEINVAHQLGFHSFLGKPLNANKFPDQFERILRGEPVWEVQ